MERLMKIATDAAIMASKEIMRIYESADEDFGIELKGDDSPLTLADKASHKCIIKHLEQTNIPVLSEEGANIPYEERKEWKRLWIVDPLDGTKEFIKRNGEFTINIALVENGAPLYGLIYLPVKREFYAGLVGYGSYKFTGEKVLHMQTLPFRQVEPRPFTVAASRSHLSPDTDYYIKLLRKEHGLIEVVNRGSSLKMCMVAEGSADVYPRFAPTMEWDTAAGDAICRAAGRKVVDAKTGEPLTYNKPDLHNPWFVAK